MWDERAVIHARGNARYRVDRLLSGKNGWADPVPDDLGPVRGKTMLHLQCHIGLDSLAWAKRGAVVTGVDYAPRAIEAARVLSQKSGIPARFIESDVYGLPRRLNAHFDMVITTYGVLCWLPDLTRWARVVARFLKPSGFLYLAEIHPFVNTLEFTGRSETPTLVGSYFHRGVFRYHWKGGTYAVPNARTRHNVHYGWQHSLADVVAALRRAGLAIEYLHEFPYAYCNLTWYTRRRTMRKGRGGFWHLSGWEDKLPLMFSLKARRA